MIVHVFNEVSNLMFCYPGAMKPLQDAVQTSSHVPPLVMHVSGGAEAMVKWRDEITLLNYKDEIKMTREGIQIITEVIPKCSQECPLNP